MIVEFKHAAGTIPLAGTAGVSSRVHSPVGALLIEGQAAVQLLRRVRALRSLPSDRRNLSARISFDTRKIFPTHAEACEFAADFPGQFPRSGEVIFNTGAGTRTLADAVVQPPRCIVEGCQVYLTYVAVGTEIRRADPEILITKLKLASSSPLHRFAVEASGRWFEVGFLAPSDDLVGNAVDGWTDAGGNLLYRFEHSLDLVNWDHDFIDAPSSPEAVGDGDFIYWARLARPEIYNSAIVDLRITSTRVGKSITGLSLFGAPISLPGYPYAMPAAASTLQAHLRTAGFTGAIVSSTTAAWGATIQNYDKTPDFGGNPVRFDVTWSGATITALHHHTTGAAISLPGYPYTMPTQEALLESHLIAAGYPYAQATLSKDQWTILLPDIQTTGTDRKFEATITPADPIQQWSFFGSDNGINTQTLIAGINENVRVGGSVVSESPRQFARLGISAGPNYQY